MNWARFLGVALALACLAASPVPYKVQSTREDKVQLADPSGIRFGGVLGGRIEANAENRLAKVDLEPLLAGFRKKPGSHPWIGEHIGKWLHASTLAWAHTENAELRGKLDYAVAQLIKAQESDGYLGTYLPENRFKLAPANDWDVWSHKYCLMGLLTYYEHTGHTPALDASRRAADLLLATFGPGKKSILSAGTHVGMASTSVLEPMVLLYRHTADPRYLEFCKYIVQSWKEPGGPNILDSLLSHGEVNRTANAKAYEMLSNLVGLAELTRVTGEKSYLMALSRAWNDVATNHLYITGSASQSEHFKDDHLLPNETSAHVAETCVTTTWIQLNSQLLRLTGEAKYAAELERTFYNHLAAAQRPDGAEWCYFTSLSGVKPYGPGINCCVSSGPRGMAMAPLHGVLLSKNPDTILYNLFETRKATVRIGDAQVEIEQNFEDVNESRVHALVHIRQKGSLPFAFAVRQPDWAASMRIKAKGVRFREQKSWWKTETRAWPEVSHMDVEIRLKSALVPGTHGNEGLAALHYGPFILAYDDALNNEPVATVALATPLRLKQTNAQGTPRLTAMVRSVANPKPHPATFVPFAEAGAQGSRFKVWLPAPGQPLPEPTGAAGEDRSRQGNLEGSICDGNSSTFVVTFDATLKKEDWFSIELLKPGTVRKVEFAHGKTFHDGGWFDTSAGRPVIQVKRTRDAKWETVAELTSYPQTTATDSKGLGDGQPFAVEFAHPTEAFAVRILGKPACGDNPKQAFSSCAELAAQ